MMTVGDYYDKDGNVLDKNKIVKGEGNEYTKVDKFIKHHPKHFVLCIVDHVKLMNPEKDCNTTKSIIDKWSSDYCLHLRDVFLRTFSLGFVFAKSLVTNRPIVLARLARLIARQHRRYFILPPCARHLLHHALVGAIREISHSTPSQLPFFCTASLQTDGFGSLSSSSSKSSS